MKTFYALVHQDDDSAFGISFPDVPACFAAADEENEVVKYAQEALSLYATGLDVLPSARSLQEIRRDPEVQADLSQGAFIIAVQLITMDHKARYNLMLDAGLVAGIDSVAKTIGVSRSEFISHTMQQRLEHELGTVIVRRAKGGSKRQLRRKSPNITSPPLRAAASALTKTVKRKAKK
jgi:predicted RNase H-like HicB family nuclease